MEKAKWSMHWRTAALCALMGACFLAARALPASADEIGELKAENAALKARVEALESEMRDMKDLLGAISGVKATKPAAGEGVPVKAKLPIELYGYIKLDASRDSARMSPGNYAMWVMSEDETDGAAPGANDAQFSMTARQTRLGMNFSGPEYLGGTSSGKVEVDFYNAGAGENKSGIMMRNAYLKFNWPDSDLSLIAGQTSDAFSPVVPNTLNYSVAWWAGNIGYRRPQLQLKKGVDVGGAKATFQLALARTIDDAGPFSDDIGADAGAPGVQGRAALSFKGFQGRATEIGVSGHMSKEEYDTDALGSKVNLDSWSANLDFNVPLSALAVLSGEIWRGENLKYYCGGIGQGIVTKSDGSKGEAPSSGGWAALAFGPYDRWSFNAGGGLDNPDDANLAAGARTKNSVVWANAVYDLKRASSVGLEISRWQTDYKGLAEGDALRVQGSLTFTF